MDLDRIATWLGEALTRTGPLAPAILFVASFVEYVFPPFPGDLVVVLGAWYAVKGTISWPFAFAAVTAGAVLGSFVDYSAGRWLSRRIDARATRRGPLSAERLHRFAAAYQRWGPALLLANRFLPGLRGFLFVAAGASGIPLVRVLVLGAISAAVWNALLLVAGAFLVRSLPELLTLLRLYGEVAWATIAALVIGVGVFAWRRRVRAARREEQR